MLSPAMLDRKGRKWLFVSSSREPAPSREEEELFLYKPAWQDARKKAPDQMPQWFYGDGFWCAKNKGEKRPECDIDLVRSA